MNQVKILLFLYIIQGLSTEKRTDSKLPNEELNASPDSNEAHPTPLKVLLNTPNHETYTRMKRESFDWTLDTPFRQV